MNPQLFDPIQTSNKLRDDYIKYLSSRFYLQDDELREQFKEKLNQKKLINGPYLEVTPMYQTGASLNQLISEEVLSEKLKENKKYEPNMVLYTHQEEGIRKIVEGRRNVVAASGTGSGKSFIYLISILNYLLRQKEQDKLDPGVRALLVFPLNALANDQLDSLRELLVHYPKITFGRYTGDTKESRGTAEQEYRKMHDDEPLPNELLSRQEMRNTPPHILLTNFSMLEYLMLRPGDSMFFSGKHAQNWRFIVFDEAHVYSGSRGIETAMLIRRVKERVVKSRKGKLQCIATSATLGEGKSSGSRLVDFAENLFGEKFDTEDIIQAQKKPISRASGSWGKPDPELYIKWAEYIANNPDIEDKISFFKKTALRYNVPPDVFNIFDDIPTIPSEELTVIPRGETKEMCKYFIYCVLKEDENVMNLQDEIQKKTWKLSDLAEKIFNPSVYTAEESNSYLIAVIYLANCSVGIFGRKLLPARFHLFVKELEGAYTALKPEKKLMLENTDTLESRGSSFPVFELAACRNCGASYLAGTVKEKNGRKILTKDSSYSLDEGQKTEYFMLLENSPHNPNTGQEYILCGKCGAFESADIIGKICSCKDKYYHHVLRSGPEKGALYKCFHCAKTSSYEIVSRFSGGSSETSTILASTLFEMLPEPKIEKAKKGSNTRKKLITFADSRQDAAYFPLYFDQKYRKMLHRQVIIQTIKENNNQNWETPILAEALTRHPLISMFSDSGQEHLNEAAWKIVLFEFLNLGRENLENIGLLGFSLPSRDSWSVPDFFSGYGLKLNTNEAWRLYQILLNSVRHSRAAAFPENADVEPDSEYFGFGQNLQAYFLELPEGKKIESSKANIKTWSPLNADNTRLNYISKLQSKMNLGWTREKERAFLREVWESFSLSNAGSIWQHYFKPIELNGRQYYQLKTEPWTIKSTIIDPELDWYRCSKCGNITLNNLKNICPSYRCTGELKKTNKHEGNFYYNFYTKKNPMGIKTSEHSAQLSSTKAAEVQKRFVEGEINLLSSSTTFELGVDIGDLESVFMRNVPPKAANYIQRAGRAGRRRNNPAFVLTYAKKRSHDMYYFENPESIIRGEVAVPHFKISNEKVIKRHIHSEVLSEFWDVYDWRFGNNEALFFKGLSPVGILKDYYKYPLDRHKFSPPEGFKEKLKRIIPDKMHKKIGLDTWSWLDGFLGSDGVLAEAQDEIKNDINILKNKLSEKEEEYESANNKKRKSILKREMAYIESIKNAVLKQNTIQYLSRRNVLPKYGFPVDVVNLTAYDFNTLDEDILDLNRDLKIALTEYAPGSIITADKKQWVSRYVNIPVKKQLIEYEYAVCECGHYNSTKEIQGSSLGKCPHCGKILSKAQKKGKFVVPDFGFKAKKTNNKRAKTSPTFTCDNYFSASRKNAGIKKSFNIGGRKIKLTASKDKIAVINKPGRYNFRICKECGYAHIFTGRGENGHEHHTYWNKKCSGFTAGDYTSSALGYEYQTDVLQIRTKCPYPTKKEQFAYSLLSGLLAGVSAALDIERNDIDGCLYYSESNDPCLVLFDDVPGGVGFVSQLADEEIFKLVLDKTLKLVEACGCEKSCYGCLRTYNNQKRHDILDKGLIKGYIFDLLS